MRVVARDVRAVGVVTPLPASGLHQDGYPVAVHSVCCCAPYFATENPQRRTRSFGVQPMSGHRQERLAARGARLVDEAVGRSSRREAFADSGLSFAKL